MKKIIIIVGIIMSFILISNDREEYLLIPNEAIRIRVIANSNLKNDIEIKEKIKEKLNIEINKILKDVDNINEARKIIKENLDLINKYVDKNLKELNYNKDFKINYGMNFFPEKIFNDVKYNAGYYESLVITLGNGLGPNYWCVLYPPLCLIDNNDKKFEYKFYIKELLDKYL